MRSSLSGFTQFLFTILVTLTLGLSVVPRSFGHSVLRHDNTRYEFSVENSFSGISEQDVRALLEVFQREFEKDFAGHPWQFNFDWQNPYLGAGSSNFENIARVILWGGIVRAEFLNHGALAALICHELGHHLGGEPLQVIPISETAWASVEGQADHFASTICLPRIYLALNKEKPEFIQKQVEIREGVREHCQSVAESQSQACRWRLQSAIDLMEFLQVYFDREEPFAIPFERSAETPPETIVLSYPSYQCRMQTLVDGALCTEGRNCKRPRCWYVEETSKAPFSR